MNIICTFKPCSKDKTTHLPQIMIFRSKKALLKSLLKIVLLKNARNYYALSCIFTAIIFTVE